jgi:hypothetical protein
VVVQNMPGAGSMRAVNALYNTAPKDGTAIGMFGRDMPLTSEKIWRAIRDGMPA